MIRHVAVMYGCQIATSVCARGLDVKDLILVVNYDCPNHYEDYVHRCGSVVFFSLSLYEDYVFIIVRGLRPSLWVSRLLFFIIV